MCEDYGRALADSSQQQMRNGCLPEREWWAFEANLRSRLSFRTMLDAQFSILQDNIGYSRHHLRADFANVILAANAHPHPSTSDAAILGRATSFHAGVVFDSRILHKFICTLMLTCNST